MKCIECGDELLAERAELGFEYCTKKECQAARHRGLTVTAIGVNKSADVYLVADQAEITRRGESGEFGKKNAGLGIDSCRPVVPPAPRHPPEPRTRPRPARPTRPAWTPQQARVVRLYHEMGLSPRQIVERARANTPRLGLTETLVVKILSSPR
ncbi:hypothetical protein [Pseudonocardia acaciae]|uniref:hypothetical protein n=1 Tax=Pseudonocardia acaciae TaxID=551276 RepID=UPI00048B28C3|nr:hypothetical protein [Pseudonocardia acaciae]